MSDVLDQEDGYSKPMDGVFAVCLPVGEVRLQQKKLFLVSCCMAAELAPSGGAQIRAASRWRRVGSVCGFSSPDGSWQTRAAALWETCSMGMLLFELRERM